ncbi:sugar ABC transporter permease [Paenibacillus swuensis]|uniref:Sugar ABC transporter permease n=1 Tax=Paenibacillus swuensis TaxID=1178515 RepID=A0A172TJ30_9BACL|nr:carbohydrate ABC transporter permease [Paenibacillus swuensis]ANE46904.1 sugar ABC transporter permease [Paenibacillus swuensis]
MQLQTVRTYKVNELSKPSMIAVHCLFILLSAAFILPVFLLIAISLTDEAAVYEHGYQFWPSLFSFDAYSFLFEDPTMVLTAYGVTSLVTLLGTLGTVILVTMYAYPLSKRDLPFRKAFTWFILFTFLFSGGLVPFYLVYTQLLHVKDTIWALILPLMSSPFWIIVARTYFKDNIPEEIVESARIDGAGEMRIFVQIVLPLSLPMLSTIALFTSFTYWNDWFNSLLFVETNKELYSLQFVMQRAIRELEFIKSQLGGLNLGTQVYANVPSETVRMAMVIVAMGPLMLAYPFFQKYFIKGLTVGAVKG